MGDRGLCKAAQFLPSNWVVLMECAINCYCSFICTNQWICKWVPPSDNLTIDMRQQRQSFLLNSKRKFISFFILSALPRFACSVFLDCITFHYVPGCSGTLCSELYSHFYWFCVWVLFIGCGWFFRFAWFSLFFEYFHCFFLKKPKDFLSLLRRREEEMLDTYTHTICC